MNVTANSATRWVRRSFLPVFALLVTALTLLPASARAAGECASASNPIVCENQLPGDPPSNWQIQGVGDPTIQGFATSMSANVGQTENFKIDTPSSDYHIDILRLGYYKGDGARLIATNIKPTAHLPQIQPECLKESSTGLIDCGNWGVSAQWTVPSNAVSGVYIAQLIRDDTGGESQIPFVVRNDSSHSDVILQTSDASWEAYNDYGGNSLYTCTVACPPGTPKAYKGAYSVSYNRPFDGAFTTDSGASYLYYAEYQMIYWLEENGYNVSYTSENEVANNGPLLKNHKVFMSSGHDEYWSDEQRANVMAAREAGVSLAFFSGNEIFWKTRWGPSIDGSNTPSRTLTTYKETHFEGPVDPKDPPTWTGAWRDPRGGPADADGGQPENALSGQQFTVNSGTSEITVPGQYNKLKLWRNTAVEKLQPEQTLTLAPGTGTLGYEWDEDVDNGFRPAGEFDLSSTTVSGVQAFTDYGSTLNSNATATHHLTLYRAPSGALVFGAGTVQWSWGLANINAWDVSTTEPSRNPPDPNMEQMTVNLLAEMGTQPGTLISGLVPAEKSTDTTSPTSTITSPQQGETFQDGSKVTVTGTATDAGGGVVAGVEVSTNNGATWHPATLATADEQSIKWSYAWAAHGYPTTTIKSRAVDDSTNLESPSAGVQVKVSCPCSIWGSAVTPPTADSGDTHSTELGVKFTSETFGTVTGVRFYKSAANTGTHIGTLWSASGQQLATATFTSESESGWQQVNFSTPVDVFPNTTYVAAYFDPAGHYADSQYYFYTPPPTGGNALNSPPLHAVAANAAPVNGAFASENGLFSYTSASGFPTSSFNGSNYWVDPVFATATAPGAVTNASAKAGGDSATVSWNAPAEGGPTTTYTITPYVGSEAQTATTITGTPPASSATVRGLTSGTSYTFRVQASNPNGAGPMSAPSNAVTPTAVIPPSAPTNVTASGATGQALVSWTEPSSTGGGPISSYTITPYVGATAQTPTEVGGSVTSTIVKGLTNGATYTFTVTAVNAAGNSPASAASSTVFPENTIFDFATPATINSADAHSVELGVKFSSELAGVVTGIRFYKSSANTGTHVGSLWTAGGALLTSATFTSETASGWQQVNFATPVAISANTTYVAGYLAPKGDYSDTASGFVSSGVNNPPLHALANSSSVNGLYSYATTTTFPTSTFKATNYWVDVDFVPTSIPGPTTNLSATAGPGAATVSWSAPTEGGAPTEYTITPYIGTEAQTATKITGTPPTTNTTIKGLTAGTTYTFKVQAANANGAGPVSSASNAVTPTAIVPPGRVATVNATAGARSATVSWSAPTEGGAPTEYTITPYIGTEAQTATKITGTPPTTNTTIKGLTAGTTYTFKVQAANETGAGPVSVESNAVTPLAMAPPGAPTGVNANSATSQAQVSWSEPSSNGGSPITGYTITPYIGSTAQTPVEITGNTTSAIVKSLTNNTNYTFTVTATNAVGNSSPSSASNTIAPENTIFDFATPATIDSGETTSTEVGVKFSSEVAGTITGIRYYKATNNTGTHIGSLWSASGTLLASATFTSETASGWQQVNFSTPVTISAFTTYVAGYLAPVGHYSTTPLAFAFVGVSNPPLQALDSPVSPNGIYAHSSTSVFPTNTSEATNYWVDVDFLPTPLPGQVTNVSATAGPGAANVSWSAPTEGGVPTQYTVIPYIGTEAQTPTTVTGTPTPTGIVISGLTVGTSYTFTVQAADANGTGPVSTESNPVVPTALVAPGTPSGVGASGATRQAQVSWSEPSSNGGSPITGYTITPYIGSTAQTPVEITGNATSAIVKSLTNNTNYTFTVTATNAVGNSSPSSASNTIAPENTIFDFATPATIEANENTPVTLGVKFSSEAAGTITGIRYYKATNNTGTHIGSLWSASGTLLASATFTSETASGWQQVNFSTPVTITPNTTYVAGYFAPSGHYSYTTSAFASVGASNPPLQALANPISANGVFTYNAKSTFPTSASNASNYWVDVDFVPTPLPGQATNVSATAGPHSANVSWSAPTEGGAPTEYTITPYIGTEAQTATKITGTPPTTNTTIKGLTAGTTYTFKVQAANANGTGPVSTESNPVVPTALVAPGTPSGVGASGATRQAQVSWSEPSSNGGSPITGYTITPYIGSTAQTPVEITGNATSAIVKSLTNNTNYTFTVTATNAVGNSSPSSASNTIAPENTIFDFATPATIEANENTPVTLGVKFSSEAAGTITGIRYYKATNNTGTHIGSLWSASGTLLASATFTSETASGWQQVNFSTPVTITPNTTYVAGYFAPSGHYSYTTSAFASVGASNPPLQALANPISANGVFTYNAKSTFPTSASNASNYWVDVDFVPTPLPGQATNVSATAGPHSANVSWSAPTEGGAPTEYTITPYIGTEAQTATKITGTPPTTNTTIKGLTAGTTYTFKVQAANANGTGPVSTESNPVVPQDTIFEFTTPTIVDSGDGNSVELGVKFSSEVAGAISGVRFYKASTNTGTHIGSLWSASGTLLASATFTGETASGWQQVNFSTPVTITPNTTYVAGYFAPKGHYSDTSSGFASAGVSNPPLQALANSVSPNGVYTYSSSSIFPTGTYKSTNYWVDVVFVPSH